MSSNLHIQEEMQLLLYRDNKTTADTYLDITEKIEEDELQKFASNTKR